MKKSLTAIIIIILALLVGCQSEVEPRIEKMVIVGDEEMEVGEVIKLVTNITSTVNWFSSDEEIAIVSNGFVTALAEGVVTITAEKASNILISDTIEITIIPAPIIPNEENILYYQTKILSIDETAHKIELLNCPFFTYTDATKFVKVVGDQISLITLQEFYIGMENIYVACDANANVIKTMMMDGEVGFSNIRVGIRNTINDFTNQATLYHPSAEFRFTSDGNLQTYDGSFKTTIDAGATVQIAINSGRIRVTNGGTTLLETYKRIIFSSSLEEITITSITRSVGNPKYAGTLEVAIINNKLVIVNDVDIENYLTKVVPSEMPSSYHVEALKAQAIAARTYAYMDIFNKSNDAFGYTVDDSVKSQVYNNGNTASSTTNAVNETQGLIMTHDGTPVQAYFYSTSSGLTASAHDVWITEGESGTYVPYLIGHNLTTDQMGNPIPFDYTSEASALAFFKQIEMNTPDTNTSYHRWRVTITKAQLATILNQNLTKSYTDTPNLILTYEEGSWVSKAIPTNIGEVLNMEVGKRGSSGVVISLIITTTTGIYKIINQYNIRFTIRPNTAGSPITTYGATSSNTTYTKTWSSTGNLFSGFFAIEAIADGYTLYGGGNGHGVGMSQNGANGLAKQGVTFQEILTSYYSEIELPDITYTYQENAQYRDLLQFADALIIE